MTDLRMTDGSPRAALIPAPFVAALRGRRIAAVRAVLASCLLAACGVAGATLPIETWTTENGVRVLFVRADAIPMLDVQVDIDAGGRYDPPAKAGVASVTAAMLGKGVQGMDEQAIGERFATLGALRGAGAGDDRASVSLRTLTSEPELSGSVGLLARLISSPTFPAAVLAREKESTIQSLREAETKPEFIAQRTFGRTLYPGHPYGIEPTVESVTAITRDDLVAFHRTHFNTRRTVVSMIGAISRAQAEAIARELVKDLPRGQAAAAPAEPAMPTRAVELRIPHPASQSHILIGQPAIARNDPDFFPLTVGNYILGGGGFVSRLYSEVREKRGLAYSVYSYFSPQLQPGPFTIGLQTQKAQTDTALDVVRSTLSAFLADGPTAAELEAAKGNLVGGFPLRIDSNRKILDNLATIGYYGLPLDYLDRWTERVQAVTLQQIRDAFARKLSIDRMATIVVGAGPATPAAR